MKGECALHPHKRSFETEALADAAAGRLAAQLGRRIRTYACSFCAKWHLTKRKRKLNGRRLSPKKLRWLNKLAEMRKLDVSSNPG